MFAPGRLDLTIHDRFGRPVQPREWYLAPLPAIEDAVNRVIDGSITDHVYGWGRGALQRPSTQCYMVYENAETVLFARYFASCPPLFAADCLRASAIWAAVR